MKHLTADDVITRITEAGTADEAMSVLTAVPRRTLEQVADQLYVDYYGRNVATVRAACISEARA